MNKTVYILGSVRTPLGSFGGQLAGVSAIDLGAHAIRNALSRANVDPNDVDEVLMGNVVSAGLGQAPARQAALKGGIPNHVPCTTINKVCASSAKAIMLGAQSIMLGMNDIVVVGGMESMSNIPFYLPNARFGYKYGDGALIDGLAYDGLRDPYFENAMGVFADSTAKKYNFTREDQDAYAIQSYKRAAAATENKKILQEIAPFPIPQRKGDPILMTEDEEFKRVKFDKIPSLRPAFSKDGTVTAANASTINDGASAMVLVSEEKLKELGLKPQAKILGFADASHEPEWFTTAPPKATEKALKMAKMDTKDIDFFEVNEAFAVVPMAYNRELNVSEDKVNVYGGAVSLGHPLGASGARIMTTLLNVMDHENGSTGCISICNGGGGGSSIIVEKA